MQDPLMSATQFPGQQLDQELPDPVGARTGLLYPRWPLLSALFINVLGAIGYFLVRFGPCPSGTLAFLSFICNIQLSPLVQILLIWLAFLIIWLLSFIFGYGAIEGRHPRNSPIRSFLRTASDFEPIRWLIVVYGGLALLGILAMLVFNQPQPVPFALASIVVFVALWVYFRRLRRPAPPSTPQEQLNQSIAATVSPGYVFRSLPLIRGIFPPRPPRRNPGTAAPGMQPPP